jgi:hypothetical protein
VGRLQQSGPNSLTERRLLEVSAELRQLVEALSRKWSASGRLTSKRAEVQSLLGLYRDVLVILDRITSEGMPAMAFVDEYMRRPPQRSDASELAAAQELIARLAVDVKSLYHWTYAIEDFLRYSSVARRMDLSELNRISIFRHNLVVHHGRTPMRKGGQVATSAQTWGPDTENFRLMTHPIGTGPSVWLSRSTRAWQGQRRRMARLSAFVPGLKAEENLWEKTDLIYRHFNRLPPADRQWVRNQLFGTVGLRSDPPVTVAQALLEALTDFKKRRRL